MKTTSTSLALMLVTFSAVNSLCAQNGNDDPITAMNSAWRERTRLLSDFECSWEEVRIHHPGSLIPGVLVNALGLGEQFAIPIDSTTGWPSVLTTATAPRLVRMHGDWMYHEDFSISPMPIGGDAEIPFVLETRRSAFDGEDMATLSSNSVVATKKEHDDLESATWLPLRSFVRPFGSEASDSLKVKDLDVVAGKMVIADLSEDREFTVDASRDFVIIGYRQFLPQSHLVILEFSVAYEQTNGHYLPSGWELTQFKKEGNDKPAYQLHASSVRWVIGQVYGKDDFQLKIPSGTRVTDIRSVDESAKNDVPSSGQFRWVFLLFNVVAAGICLVFVGLRWRKRRKE